MVEPYLLCAPFRPKKGGLNKATTARRSESIRKGRECIAGGTQSRTRGRGLSSVVRGSSTADVSRMAGSGSFTFEPIPTYSGPSLRVVRISNGIKG